ncbi:hypothetical protein ACN27F_34380 [Solwaraspora sp. WMMB335]|uniref:hypothetical protein n=1 Tax=Solwaraspora sp. WMMB335 TaxID=3404118 RepID=UPI003B92A5C4
MTLVLDTAGGAGGGAARWRAELDRHLRRAGAGRRCGAVDQVTVIGRGRRITPGWLLRRESLARRARTTIAANNVSFLVSGGRRVVLARNALHFLYPDESHLATRLPPAWRAQIPVVRRSLERADVIVVPCSPMAERVVFHRPALAARIVVRPHPVTAVPRRGSAERALLVPVVPGPYKNLTTELRSLVAVLAGMADPPLVRVTASRTQLPPDLADHPLLRVLGPLPSEEMTDHWATATGIFYPCVVESFGYPLAEARAGGVAVIAPDGAQAREIAGGALRPYRPADPRTLREAVIRLSEPVVPDPDPFSPADYFDWLLDGAAG